MRRKIKFRGKRIDNGEWIYGSLVTSFNGEQTEIVSETHTISFLVIPETVGQFTNMKDKNLNDIYEGDIVTTRGRENYIVVWQHSGWKMKSTSHKSRFAALHPRYSNMMVIGNIHENPELLTIK